VTRKTPALAVWHDSGHPVRASIAVLSTLIGGFLQANRPSNTDSFTGLRGLGTSRT
jgi:hypothetical protein